MDPKNLSQSRVRRCVFCAIVRGEAEAYRVFEDGETLAFLDYRPLLKGHCLVIPKGHVELLTDLSPEQVGPFFRAVQLLARGVEEGLEAHGSFVAVNVKISQSIPHLHAHVVPRWRKDGLFSYKLLWKRTPYSGGEEMAEVAGKIRQAVETLLEAPDDGKGRTVPDRNEGAE